MRVRRGLGIGAAVVVAVVAALACGDTINNVTVVAPADAGDAAVATGRDASDGPTDGGMTDANTPPDAPYDGPGCANDQSPTSDACQVARLCESSACAAPNSVRYQCFDSGGATRPPIDGCNYVGIFQSTEEWCCPPACVPRKSGPGCAAGQTALACPNFDGGPVVTPDPGCVSVISDGTARYYCCP